jgi:nucleotide-binding universal stress UspA family protein
MKPCIIVTTDFTGSSANALDYTSTTALGKYKLLLAHIYTMPAGLAAEGMALTVFDEYIRKADMQIEVEAARIRSAHPAIEIETRVIVGGLLQSLMELIKEIHPEAIVMGALKNYADLGTWDSEVLGALTGLPVPVLMVPYHFKTATINNIGFACDYRTTNSAAQVSFIKTIIKDTGARLHVVHISSAMQDDNIKRSNEEILHQLLAGINPIYYAVEDPDVIDAIAGFVTQLKLDILVVVPHRHGFWHSLFNESHTKQLAKLNDLPVLALPD